MKKTWMTKLGGLLLIFAAISGCQEKIAPELSTPASTTVDGGGSSATTINRFYLTLGNTPNTEVDPDDLGYVLHKTNNGAGVNCQVDDVVDTPESLDSTRDISCFLEAEEFALYYNGFNLKANSDANTCEYIVAKPFYYWNFPPGISRRITGAPRQVVRFICDEAVVDHLPGNNIPALYGNPSPTYTTVGQLCNRYFNLNDSGLPLPLEFGQLHLDILPSLAGAAIDESSLCTYNYENDGEELRCDEGEITVYDVNVSGTDTDDPADNIPDVITVSGGNPRDIKCGGNVKNCMAGPAVDFNGRTDFNNGITGKIVQLNGGAGDIDMPVNESHLIRPNNYYAANFMRQCSGVPNYNAANSFTPLPGVEFDPNVMSAYTYVGVETTGLQEKDTRNLDVIPLADHAFRGGMPMSVVALLNPADALRNYGVDKLGTNPFYTFSCLDHAYDLKARIRVAVREWNRNFSPSTQNFQFVSDVYNRALPYSTRTKMDAGSAVSLLEYPTVYDDDPSNDVIDFYFNNVRDWDDLLTFDNSPTGACGSAINVDGSWVTPLPESPKSTFWFPREIPED